MSELVKRNKNTTIVEGKKPEIIDKMFSPVPADATPLVLKEKVKKAEITSKKQTCLEKIAIKERKNEINKNIYNGKTQDKEYSSVHKNALSDPTSEKGKGTNDGGHTYFQPNYGKPKETPNAINYSNFITISDKTRSVGNKTDIEKRNESYLTRRYNYNVNEYSSKNEDALSSGNVLGKGTDLYLDTINGGGGYDVLARDEHLMRNEWKKDLQYTKLLVNSEYDIQTEFEISSYGEDLEEMKEQAEFNQLNSEIKKAEKAAKKLEKTKRKYQKRLDKEVNKEPQKPAERLDYDYEKIQHDTYSPTDYSLYGYDIA